MYLPLSLANPVSLKAMAAFVSESWLPKSTLAISWSTSAAENNVAVEVIEKGHAVAWADPRNHLGGCRGGEEQCDEKMAK